MAKYAICWTTDKGYFPGTNASLNAMEYYGFPKDIDIYILTGGDFLTEEYKKQWPNVKFIDFFAGLKPEYSGHDHMWYYVYADIIFALDHLQEYDTVLLWGGDLCILDDFSDYFSVADKLEAMVLGTNEHGSHYLDNLGKEWPYGHTWSVPYADAPFFVSRKWYSVFSLMLDYTKRPGNMIDRMDGMNYAIRDLNAKVFEVPGELWVQNVPYRYRLEMGKGNRLYLYGSSTRMKAFHRKYWNANICHEYLPGGREPEATVSRINKTLFNRMYNFFNRDCRVKWTEGLEVWDGI